MFRQALWDFVGRFVNYFVIFAVGIVITRLLSPDEYGVYGIVMAVVLFSNVFLDFGFRVALIQAKELTQKQLSTVFFLNLLVAFVLFAAVLIAAPFIENFYGNKDLANPLTAMSVLFILNGLMLVPNTLLNREMRFKPISIANTVSAVIAGLVGILLAYAGFKVWALILQSLLASVLMLIGLVIAAKWKPSLEFSFSAVKHLWKLSSTVFFLTILDNIYTRMDVFIIGKLFDFSTLGFYNRAQSLDGLVRNFSVGTLSAVVLPFFSKIQDDTELLRNYYKRSINLVLFVSVLLSGVLFLTATDLIIILFTEKWATAASYYQIIALTGFIYPLSAVMINVIVARGNSREFITLEILKRIVLTPSYLFIYFGGIYYFLIAQIFFSFINVNLNAHFIEREIGVTKWENLKFIGLYAAAALIAGIAAYAAASGFSANHYLHLIIISTVFLVVYVTISYYLKFTGILEISDKIKEFISSKQQKNEQAISFK